ATGLARLFLVWPPLAGCRARRLTQMSLRYLLIQEKEVWGGSPDPRRAPRLGHPALFVLLLCLSAEAQIPTTKADVPSPPRVGVGITQAPLSLEQAIEMALRNNPEIDIEKTNIGIASAAAKGALGFMDPNFRWQPLLESRDTPTGSVLASSSGKVSEHFN